MAVAAGDDVAVAREDMGFDEFQLAFVAHWRVGDDEQRVTEGFQLGPAVFFQGIFDGQFVQVELGLQVGQLFGIGLFQADPHEMPRLARPLAAFVDADVGDLSAGAVHRRCHDSTHGCPLIRLNTDTAWAVPGSRATPDQASSFSMRSMHCCICPRHCSISAGRSCSVMPVVAMGGSERTITVRWRQLFRLRRLA